MPGPTRFLMNCALLLATLTGKAFAQTGDGFVGVYRDSTGTEPCTTVAPYTATTLYVIAKTEGATENGITGAEFRIEVTSPTGWLLSYTPPSGASVVLGNPLDTSSSAGDNSGVNISFPSCRSPVNGHVRL